MVAERYNSACWFDEDVIEESYTLSFGDSGKTIQNVPKDMVTTKVPPAYDGRSHNWFQCEDKFYDWEDMCELNGEMRGPLCRARLSGYAEQVKYQLDRASLKKKDGLEYFIRKLRPLFVKNAYSVFMYRFLQFTKQHRGRQHWIPWEARIRTQHKRLTESWMDLYEPSPYSTRVEPSGTDGDTQWKARLDAYNNNVKTQTEAHEKAFPVTEQLMALMAIVQAEMNMHERERFDDKIESIAIKDYTRATILQMFNKLFVNAATAFENPHLSGVSTVSSQRSFYIIEEGMFKDGSFGYWAIDEEDDTEGFLRDDEDVFWTLDSNDSWIARRFAGRKFTGRRGKGKGKISRKGGRTGFKGRRFFKPYLRKGESKGKGKRQGKSKYGYAAEEYDDGQEQYADWSTGKGKGKWKSKNKGFGKSTDKTDDTGSQNASTAEDKSETKPAAATGSGETNKSKRFPGMMIGQELVHGTKTHI